MSEIKSIMPPSPIKTSNKTNKDRDLTPKEETQFRKKNISEYVATILPEDYSKTIKPKVSSNSHSRKNSDKEL